MNVRDIIGYAIGTMGRRKLRTSLTSLGVAIGIAAIVALLSITQGLQTSVQNELANGLGTDTLTITPTNGGSLLINDTAAIEGIEHVMLAVPLIQKAGYLRTDNASVRVNIVGMDMDKYRTAYSSVFVAQLGSIPIDPTEDVIIVGARVYDPGSNGTSAFWLGSSAEVVRSIADGQDARNMSYAGTITGVLNTIGPISIGVLSDSAVYVPIERASSFYGTDRCSMMVVKLVDDRRSTIDEVTTAIQERFDGQVQVSSPQLINSVASRVFSLLDLFLIGVAGITLFIAGIGIMNTMTVSLMERTREIGTLKSLGSKNRTVLAIFLCEASIIGLMGGFIGTALGYLLASFIAAFLNDGGLIAWSDVSVYADIIIAPEISSLVVIMAISFGLLISVIFSLYPAWRASRMNPVDALRHT